MSLKAINNPLIISYIILVYIAFIATNNVQLLPAILVAIEDGKLIYSNPLLTIALPIIEIILLYIIPSSVKNSLVYLRFRNTLPACRVFSNLAPKDPRIDVNSIIAKYGQLPVEPIEQNKYWYKIYKEKQTDSVIKDSHRNWLLLRDLYSISLILLILMLIFSLIFNREYISFPFFLTYSIITVLIHIAAFNAGNRFACNVLAR